MNNLQAAYLTMQNACGIKVGDKVKVLTKAKSYEMGWENVWTKQMDDAIGKNFTVDHILENGIKLSYRDNNEYRYYFPFFVLEKIESAPTEEMMICEKAKECKMPSCEHRVSHIKDDLCDRLCNKSKCIPVNKEKPIDPIINFINDKCNFDCQQDNVKKIVEMLLERIGKCVQ